jgi:MFS family permease
MLGVASLVLLLSTPAQTYGFSVFIDPMLTQLGLSRSLVSGIYTVATLVSAAAVFLVGGVIDRQGHRRVLAMTTAIYAAALVVMGAVGGAWTLLLGFTLLRATGASVLTLTARTHVAQWFVRRRGRAVSVVNLGKMLGLAAVPPANALLIQHIGWRDAWRVNALVVALFVPVALPLVRNRPEEVGQFPDGRLGADEGASSRTERRESERSWTRREALRTRAMWLLLAATFVPATITNGVSFNQISILTQAGLTLTAAALTFTIESVVAMPMTFVAGWLADRFGPRPVLALGQALLAATLLCLTITSPGPTAILFGVLRGLTTGTWILATEVAWPAYFGRGHLGSIVGMAFAVSFVGAAIGPLPFGVIYDLVGSYRYAILGITILPVLSTIAALAAAPPKLRVEPQWSRSASG